MIFFEKFKNKKIAILGYGKEGKSSLQFLLKIGIPPKNITILDVAKKIEGLAENLEYINKTFGIGAEVNMILGNNYLDTLKYFDLIIKTPGISPYHNKIYPYRNKITSQAQIFFDHYQGKIIAIAGTKGKSTTCTLTYEVLKAAGKNVQLIGNIGNPVLNFLDFKNPASQKNEYAVFEVSSYTLEDLKKKNFISVLLNIYSDHIDRHDGFDNYQRAEFNVIYGSEHNILIHEVVQKNGLDEDDFKEYNVSIFGKKGQYTYKNNVFYIKRKKTFDDKGILLQGEHNMINICAVLGICNIMKIKPALLKEVLKNFKGLPHRMENIGTYGGITRIDDAISTTPESTICVIETLGKQIDTIFLGGTDRGYVFDDLVKCLCKYNIRNVVLFPDSGNRIAQAIKDEEVPTGKEFVRMKIFKTNDMKEAVKFAYKYTKNGKICLLSTASPSYTLRKNFEEKGNLFQQYAKELSGQNF